MKSTILVRKPTSDISINKNLNRYKEKNRLSESDERYTILSENISEGLYVTKNGIFSYVNSKMCKIFGYAKYELIGMPSWNLAKPEIRETVKNNFFKKIQNKDNAPLEIECVKKDGSNLIVEVSFHWNPKEGLVYGLVKDISENKKAESILKLSEERYRSLVENQTELVARIAPDGTFTYVNEVYCNFFGKSKDELVGKKWFPLLIDEDLKIIQKKIKSISPQNQIVNIENRVTSSEGKIHWIQFINRGFFDIQGNLLEILSVGRDITQRKNLEKELFDSKNMLQIVLDTIPSAVFWKDCNLNYLGANQTWLNGFGFDSAQEVNGKNDYDLPWDKEQADSYREYDRRIMKSGIPEYNIIEQYKRADGTLSWARTNKALMRNQDGNIIGIIGTFEDITEKKKIEEQIIIERDFSKTILDTVQAVILLLSLDGKIISFNKYMEEITGYKLIEVKGKDWFKTFLPQEDYDKVKQIFKKATHNTPTKGNVNPILSKSGKKIFIEWYDKALKDKEGKILGLLSVGLDITQRKIAEMRKHTILETSMDGFTLLNDKAKIIEVNTALCNMLGYSKETLLTMNISGFEVNESHNQVINHINLVKNQGTHRFQTKNKCKDGSIIDMEVSAHYLKDEDLIFSFHRDITQIKKSEEDLRRKLMKFQIGENGIYLTFESQPVQGIDVLLELIKVGYNATMISRTPKSELRLREDISFWWLAEKGLKVLQPNLKIIKEKIENLNGKYAILIDRIDYLISKNGFNKVFSFIQELKDLAYLTNKVIIISIDNRVLDEKQLTLIQKEGIPVRLREPIDMQEDLIEVVKLIYQKNALGLKPSFTDIGVLLKLSKPTVRKKIRRLMIEGLVNCRLKGRQRIVELTDKGRFTLLE